MAENRIIQQFNNQQKIYYAETTLTTNLLVSGGELESLRERIFKTETSVHKTCNLLRFQHYFK